MTLAEAKREGDWIQLVSGKPFWPLDPRSDEIEIADIAHALSMLCRYGGHCQGFYSVAEHSVLASHLVPAEHALWGLLHDATEAYLVDLPRPVKRCIPEYGRREEALAEVIAERFGLPWPMPAAVAHADTGALVIERFHLLAPSDRPWDYPGAKVEAQWAVKVALTSLACWSPVQASFAFLQRFEELTNSAGGSRG